ncbi:MAG: YraN family protein [Candidatus Aminicenantes bacterium]|nr:MAG: YraN family protein [Candidatus Aminicenantes bacterium]
MGTEKSSSGQAGERAAARYLEKQGYEILENNYRVSGAEVDLIAKKDDTLCFVEVKTRGSDDFGLPEEFVDRRKRNKIIRAAKIYTANKKYIDLYVRFDIISVIYKDGDIKINHIRYAFEG